MTGKKMGSISNEVTLTPSEIIVGATVGTLRHAESIKNGSADAHELDPTVSGLSLHVEGASAELALAKFLGKYWPCTVNTFKQPDLSKKIQVKHTNKSKPRLLVRPNDEDDHVFVLVTGRSPHFQIHGWMYGREAKQKKWEDNPLGRPLAWFVPKEELHDITTLPASA